MLNQAHHLVYRNSIKKRVIAE
ncbi:hypothetical protein V12B01_13605 [Vibrio splendidus 12B01]|nr:hypothetical protein V12B01_13605 [Vibrio splendidus 12B01]